MVGSDENHGRSRRPDAEDCNCQIQVGYLVAG
jgi:hypothetical protein